MTAHTLAWHTDAACQGHDPELWWPHEGDPDGRSPAARAICADCPVRVDCLRWVMAIEPASARHGIWGGLTPGERTTLHRCRTGQCGHTTEHHHHDLEKLT